MSKLQRIVDLCACEVSVTVNPHTSCYKTVEAYLRTHGYGLDDDVSPEVRAEMVRLGTVVQVQAYKRTPGGFFFVLHYDLDAALDEMLDILEDK